MCSKSAIDLVSATWSTSGSNDSTKLIRHTHRLSGFCWEFNHSMWSTGRTYCGTLFYDSFPTGLRLCIPWDNVLLNEGTFQPYQLLFSTLEIKAYEILTVEWLFFFFTGGLCMPRFITDYLLLDHYLIVNNDYWLLLWQHWFSPSLTPPWRRHFRSNSKSHPYKICLYFMKFYFFNCYKEGKNDPSKHLEKF